MIAQQCVALNSRTRFLKDQKMVMGSNYAATQCTSLPSHISALQIALFRST